jgi:hypothetical protein
MESALPVQPKIRSPAVSAASKEEPKEATPLDESPDADSTSGVKAINIDMSSSDKKATTIPDVAEGTMKSKNVKEDKPLEVTLTKESQEKLPGGEQGESPSVLFLFHKPLPVSQPPLQFNCYCINTSTVSYFKLGVKTVYYILDPITLSFLKKLN